MSEGLKRPAGTDLATQDGLVGKIKEALLLHMNDNNLPTGVAG
jgi:hypothetical protein